MIAFTLCRECLVAVVDNYCLQMQMGLQLLKTFQSYKLCCSSLSRVHWISVFISFNFIPHCYLGGTEDDKLALVCGSRAHLEQEAIATRSFFRTVLMKGFHLLVWLFAARSVKDTQCGFKLLTRPTARLCFPNLHIERWLGFTQLWMTL